MKKKREPLDLKGLGKRKPGAKPGDVRNPAGKVPGTLTRSTDLGNEAKGNIIQAFIRSYAPQVLVTILNLKLPMQFIPRHVRERFMDGTMTDADETMIARKIEANYWRMMDWMAKVFPKTLGVYGEIQHEGTVASRTKRATREDKSPGVVDMVRRKVEDEAYEVDKEEEDE